MITFDCGYCMTSNVGGSIDAESAPEGRPYERFLMVRCGKCRSSSLVTGRLNSDIASSSSQLQKIAGDVVAQSVFRIGQVWPPAPTPAAPAHVPEKIGQLYVQAEDNIYRQNWDSAGMTFRRVLDSSTKMLAPEHRDGTLFARLEVLIREGKMTPLMGEWAHRIRIDGNEASHDEEPIDEATAKALHAFVKIFLEYTYTLPEMIKLRRKETSAAEAL